jgi:hypothetical protein
MTDAFAFDSPEQLQDLRGRGRFAKCRYVDRKCQPWLHPFREHVGDWDNRCGVVECASPQEHFARSGRVDCIKLAMTDRAEDFRNLEAARRPANSPYRRAGHRKLIGSDKRRLVECASRSLLAIAAMTTDHPREFVTRDGVSYRSADTAAVNDHAFLPLHRLPKFSQFISGFGIGRQLTISSEPLLRRYDHSQRVPGPPGFVPVSTITTRNPTMQITVATVDATVGPKCSRHATTATRNRAQTAHPCQVTGVQPQPRCRFGPNQGCLVIMRPI